MTEPLSLERFRDLADAYGGVVARWPERHREAAMRMASAPEASAILEQASALDEMLDAWHVPAAPPALRDRLIGDAPGKSLAARARLWWSGVGIAAALAGAAAGTAAVAMVMPVDASPESSTSFGDVTGQES